MFIANVVVGNLILDRAIFWDIREASKYAREATTHKVWELGQGQFYYGEVEARIYQPNLRVTSDHKDEHILSFSHTKRNRRDVM